MNDWADEEAGLEAVQRVLDSLDDIHALQDEYVDEDVLSDMLCDNRLCALLQVIENIVNIKTENCDYISECHTQNNTRHNPEIQFEFL